MASDIRIPDSVTIKKQEDEDSYLINEQRDKIQKEIYKMEEEKLDLLLNQPPGVGDLPSSIDTIEAELNDGIKTKDNEILVTPHLEHVGNEEKCRSDSCPPSIPKEDESEMPDSEKQFHECDPTGEAKEREEYEAIAVEETCENSMQKIDEQGAVQDIKTSAPESKVEEDIIVEKEESSKDEINVDQNVEEILDRQTFVDNNDKPQNIHERNESELELKEEASAESTTNILNDDIETVTVNENAEDNPCSHVILDEEDIGMKKELKIGDCREIAGDSEVEKINREATETSRDTELEKDEKETSTSNADNASAAAMPEIQNDETTIEIGISDEAKLDMSSVSEDTDEGSKQEVKHEEGVNLYRPSEEFTNLTETHEESTPDNSIPNEGDDAEFSEQKLNSINMERQVDLQEMTESTTNESREVEELTATATGDYIDGSQINKAVQDLENKFFNENDPAEENTLVALNNEGIKDNETETPREISETISNEVEKQITNIEETSSGIEKEHIEAAYFGASNDDVPTEEELSPSNLNEVHDSANELSNNNGNDVQVKHSLLQEREKLEDQKVDEVLEIENEQKIEEANNAMTEEEKYVDNVSEACPNTEHTTGEIESLDKTVTNEMISEIISSSVEDENISGSSLEEKIESGDIRVFVPEELESTEDTDTLEQRSTIKGNKSEEQIAVDDVLKAESRNVLIEEEILEKSYEEQDYEKATLNLSGEDENLSPNEIEKKKTYNEEGSDDNNTENINEEALVDACFSPETNEVDGSSEREVEKLREEDSGRSILDGVDENYVGEEVMKHREDESEDIEKSKGESFCEVENVTGENFITNEKNEDVETQDKCFNTFKAEDVAFSEELDLQATKEASIKESSNDSTCPTKEVEAGNAIDNTATNSERQLMVAEEVAEKVLDEGNLQEEPVDFLVAREFETETLSENDQIISAAEKDIKQIAQKDDSGGELMQPLVIEETEAEVLRQNAHDETLAVEELEETKQTETEACFDSTVIADKGTEHILQKDETSEELKQLQFTNETEEKASCDNAEKETSVAREDVEQISHQEEIKEELEQLLETQKFESEASCRDAEIIKLDEYTEKGLLNEVTKVSEASCGDVQITVPKEDEEQVVLKEEANEIVQPQPANETETEVFNENVYKEILAVEESQETKKFETEASSDGTMAAEKYTERSLEEVETSDDVQQLQDEIEEKTFCDDAEETSVAKEDITEILCQDEPKKNEHDHSRGIQKFESEEHCGDEEVIAPEEDTQPIVLKEVTKELDQSLVTNENQIDALSGNSEIVVNEKGIESVEEFENVLETEETETEDNNPVIAAKDTENLQKDETSEEIKELLLTSELEAKTICEDDEKVTLVAEDDTDKDTGTNLQTYETKEEMAEVINDNESQTEVFNEDVETSFAGKDIDQICEKNESTEEIEQRLVIKESNTEGFGDNSGIVIEERNFEESLQKEESTEDLEQLQESKEIKTEAEILCGNTEIDTGMGERGSEEPFEIVESSEKFEQSIVTPDSAVERDVDEDIITSIAGEETATKEVIETARECHESEILDEISSDKSQSNDFQKDGNDANGYKELELEDVSSIEQENTTATLSSTSINETFTESSEKENSDAVELKQELQSEFKEQIEVQNSKEISADNIQLQEDTDTKALDEEIHMEERSENLDGNFFSESKVNDEEMQEEIQEKEKADSSFASILSEEKISQDEQEIKELSNEEGSTKLVTSNMNVEEERDSKSENEKGKDILVVAYEPENQIEYETDDQVHPTIIKNDQEVITEETTLHKPDYELTDLSTLPSEQPDIETTEVSEATKNVTVDAKDEDIINDEVENPLKEQEIENKLVQETDESFTQRDLSEIGSSYITQNNEPSEVQQQRVELHPPPETENQIECENDDQVYTTIIKNDQEVITEEATLPPTLDYKLTDLSTLSSEQPNIETTEATENVTVDVEGEDIIDEEEENPLKEQEIENKLGQETNESFNQRDLSEMGSLDITQNNEPSEVQQQRAELHQPPETENQIEYDTDDQIRPTAIQNDQEVIIEGATLHHTPDYKLTDLSTLPSKEPDIETTEASDSKENVTIGAEGEDIINEDVENTIKEQEIEKKLVQESDESFTKTDLSEMGSSDIVQSSALSEVKQQRDEELHPPPEIDRSTFDSNEVANLNKEELIDFEKQEVIDDKNYLESEDARNDDSKQILHSEKSEEIEQLLESKITETEAFVAEKDSGEGHQETEVIETATECEENVISDEIDSTKSQSQETVNDEKILEYFQKDGTDAIGYKEPETEQTGFTEQENFKENTTAIISSIPINETTTESSENENCDALKLKQEYSGQLQLESKEQIEAENWNGLQKDLDTKEAINEEIHVEERSENVARNLLSEFKVYETDTQEGTQEKEKSDSSFVSIIERDLSEMGSSQKSAPSEVQKQRDPELRPPPEIDTSTSESSQVANLDKKELGDFQNQYEVADDKNLQSEELEEIIFENQFEVVDEKNKLESEEAAKDDSKDILQNEKSMGEIEQLMETKIEETEALVAEKDIKKGLQETEAGVDTTEVLEHTEPCVVEKDSSASDEMGNMIKEEHDLENEYKIVDDKNNLELEGETSKEEEPSKQPNEHNAANLNSLDDQYSIGEKPTSELNNTCTDFEETSTSIEREEATAAVEVVSQEAGTDDSTVQFNELPAKEVFDTTSTGKEAKEETMEDVDIIKIHSAEITELDTFEKNFEDDQAKETNLESNMQIEATEALNEETSNQESNENFVASFVSEVSDKEVKEVRKDELITDDCKPSIAVSESENSGLNVAESEEKDMVEEKIVLDSTAINNESDSEQKETTDLETKLDFSAEERRVDIATVVEGKEEGGEYEMEEKLGVLTKDTCKEGNENLASTESKVPDQDVEEEISINDYDSPSAKFESEDLSLKAPESKEQEAETREDQPVMEIKPEDISILCKEKEEDATTLVVEGIDNREHDIEETTPTKVLVEENILTHPFGLRSDDNLPESVEIPSGNHQQVETETAEKVEDQLVETETAEEVEDIVVRDEASYGNFEPEEKLSTPDEDKCTKEGKENLTASIESKVFDEEIKEEIISKEEVDNLQESVEIPSDKHHLLETETAEKVEDIVARDEASYGNSEPEEKLNTPDEDTFTKEGKENLTASTESKVFDEEIKEEIISEEEVSTSDFDSASTKFESGDITLKVVESEEQKIQTINDQSAMEIKPEDKSIHCKDNDDETKTLAVESMVNQDHDIEETIPTKVNVEENILTRSFDFTSDSNLQETVEIPSSENQIIASESSEEVEKNIVRDEASYGNFEPEATSPTQTIGEKLDATIEGNENLVASPQSKVPDDEIKEIISKEEISINDYDTPSSEFERKDLSLKVVESEEQEIQNKEDQTTIDAKQEDDGIVSQAVESMDDREHDIDETTSKEVVVDQNVLIRSFDSTGDNLQDSAEISLDKHELIPTETTERVEIEETDHVREEVHKAVAEEAFLTTSSDTLNDNDQHDSFAVSSEKDLLTASEMIEEKVLESRIDDSPDKVNELELPEGNAEISTFVGKENDIIEQRDGYNYKDSTLDLGEEKAGSVFREGEQGQREEVAEIEEKSLLEEKNVEIDDSSETLECTTVLVNEDQNIQSKISEAEEATKDIKQENPTLVEQQILEHSREDEITSTKMEATETNEKVYDEIIKTDSIEDNEEQVIENKSTLEKLDVVSSQGAINESCEVSEDYIREINSNEKVGTIKSESEEDFTSERETTITETTQEERFTSECMEPPVNVSVSIAKESEEKITGEMRNNLEEIFSPSNEATVETCSTSAKSMEADSSFETNAKVAPSLLETQKLMDNPNTSNIPFEISAQASEYEQEVCIDDILSKSKDSEIKEKHQGIDVTSLNTTENEYESTVEEGITTENKVPNEEALEQDKFKEDHNQIILNEDSIKEDVAEEINEPLKSTSEVYYQDVVKLSEVIDEGATEKEKADEHGMLEEVRKTESFIDEENSEYLKEEETEANREIQGIAEAINKEKESTEDVSELKGPENSADNNIISKDIYQIREIAPEIPGKKLNQTEEISEGIKTRSVVGDVSPIINFVPLTELPKENEAEEHQDAKEEDREVKEHGDSSKDNWCEVRAEDSILMDFEKVISAKQKQSSIVENEPVDRTMAENTEDKIKSEELEDEKIEGAHVGDSGTDEEKGDKHDKDAVSDAPVIVEASKDIDVKVGHKKSHNILSGVGSKVKHSISKVKKAITGKSSHHKSDSPK